MDSNDHTAETLGPLAGFRVLDITSGIAGPYCARLLARYGCDVLKVERPGSGDSSRRLGPFPGGVPDPERSGMFAFLNMGKRGITLDVTAETAQPMLDRLIANCDLVLTSLRPATAESAGLLRERIARVNPAASLVAIPNFGQDGPYRDHQATGTTLYGLGGPMHVTGHSHREPVRLGPRVVEFQGGATAAFACSLALYSLAATGRGRFYDLSLLETQLASHDRQASFLMAAQFTGETFSRLDPSITTDRVWPCADGYIDVGYNSVPFDRVLMAIGHAELIGDPLFADADARQGMESQAVFTALFLEWMVQRTMLEAWTTFQQYDIPSGPVYTAREILADPHFEARGLWETMDVGGAATRVPRDMPWPGGSTPALLPAPRLGEHNSQVLRDEPGSDAGAADAPGRGASPAAAIPERGRQALPLAGIRVVELTNAVAGPSCTAALADWGADVIRVESPNHWQPGARGLMARPSAELVKAQKNWTMCYPDWEPGERPYERSAIFANSCRGKRSVALDISQPQGHAAFLRLIDRADVFVENNAPEVPAKLGVDYATLSARNPRLVMLQMPAYGHTGPHSTFRSFGNQVEAVTGHAAIRGYADSSPKELEATFTSDVGAGVFGACAVTMALTERLRTGKGQRIELALSEMFLSWLVEPLLLLQLAGVEMHPTGNRDRQHAPYGCYPTRGDDRWITIGVTTDAQWQALVDLTGDDALRSPEYATEAGRQAAHDAIDAAIAAWTREHDNRELAAQLQEAGIAAAPVLNALETLRDPHLRARRAFQALHHPETGQRDYPAPPFREGGAPPRLRSGPPLLGEHNEEILRGLAGLSRDEYDELLRLGIAGTEFRAGIP